MPRRKAGRASPNGWAGDRYEYLHITDGRLAQLGEEQGAKSAARESRIEVGLNYLGDNGWICVCHYVDAWADSTQKEVRGQKLNVSDGSPFAKWVFMRPKPRQSRGGVR